MLVDSLYRTNQSIVNACLELGLEYEQDMLEDLEQCSHCSIWYHSYELMPDIDDNNLCKFCEEYYGR